MPISPITLQRRFAELGRIRLGAKQDGKGRPMKLTAFRFTSPNRRYIDDLATLYGGQARAWDNSGKPEFEVFTDATSIPVIAMKGGLTQWMETWSGGGCVHRCDGETNALTGEPCDPNERAHRDAKPTTRLSLMLPELEAIGAWRMESHGWNAAAEIPAVAELAQFVGDLVPAHLNMIERRSVRDGQTSRFVVPVLDLQIGTARLRELVAEKSGTTALAAPDAERPALAGPAAPTSPDEQPAAPASPYAGAAERIAAASTLDELTEVWNIAKAHKLVGTESTDSPERAAFTETWRARAHELKGAEDTPTPAAQLPAQPGRQDDTVDGVVVDEPVEDNEDVLWNRIIATGAPRGLDTDALLDDFKQRMGGLLPDDASAGELRAYLAMVDGQVAA